MRFQMITTTLAVAFSIAPMSAYASSLNFEGPATFFPNGTVIDTVDGVAVSASAFERVDGAFSQLPGTLLQFPAGLGIDIDEVAGFTSFSSVDGQFSSEALVLEFLSPDTLDPVLVNLTSVTFSEIDSNDAFTIFTDQDGGTDNLGLEIERTLIDPTVPLGTERVVTVSFSEPLSAATIAFVATDRFDNFTLNEIELERAPQVPLPFSGLLLLSALGFIGVAARRSREPRAAG